METAADVLVMAIEALPDDPSNDEIVAVFTAHDRLTACLSAAVHRVDAGADGAVTVTQWLRAFARRSHRDAAALVRRADRVRSCPEVASAWASGDLATAQVDAVVANVSERTVPLFAEQSAALVPTLCQLSVRGTETAMRRWRVYAEAVVESPEPVSARRTVYLDGGLDGWGELSGRLDPAGAAVVGAALDAATVPDVDGEPPRTRGEQRADALVAVARHFLDHADVASTSRRSRPDVAVVVTLDDLERGTGRSLDGEPLDAPTLGALRAADTRRDRSRSRRVIVAESARSRDENPFGREPSRSLA